MLRAVAIPSLPKRLGGGYKPFSPEESARGKVPPRDDPETGEEEDEGDQPEPQEQLRAGLVIGPEPLEAGEHYISLNRFDRMKSSRCIYSILCRMNPSVGFSSRCPRCGSGRVLRRWRSTDLVGWCWARTIYATTFCGAGVPLWAGWYFSRVFRSTFVSHASSRVASSFQPISRVCSIVRSS